MQATPLKILLLLYHCLPAQPPILLKLVLVTLVNEGEKKSGLNGCNSTLNFPQFHKCYLLLNSVPSLYPPAHQSARAQPLQPL